MLMQDFNYEFGTKRYYVGDIVRLKGGPAEPDETGIVTHSWNDGSFFVVTRHGFVVTRHDFVVTRHGFVVTRHGFVGFPERVVSEPAHGHFDLRPLFQRLQSVTRDAVRPVASVKIGDIVLDRSGDSGIVFYIYEKSGDAAVLFENGASLGTPICDILSTGESFDLQPMFESIERKGDA